MSIVQALTVALALLTGSSDDVQPSVNPGVNSKLGIAAGQVFYRSVGGFNTYVPGGSFRTGFERGLRSGLRRLGIPWPRTYPAWGSPVRSWNRGSFAHVGRGYRAAYDHGYRNAGYVGRRLTWGGGYGYRNPGCGTGYRYGGYGYGYGAACGPYRSSRLHVPAAYRCGGRPIVYVSRVYR